MADYLIVGGGLAGCVLASRLKENNPRATVILLEAGPNEHENPVVLDPMGTFQMHNSRYEYNYVTVPQKGYDGRQVYNAGGKQLSGSTAVNFAMWTRGGASDYDLWADIVGDQRWSYKSQLPYFRKTETHHDPKADPKQHGFDGPIFTTAEARKYPLEKSMRTAFLKGTGLPAINDANNGSPIGVAPYTENWHPKGYRQPAGRAYGLKGVEVITDAQVHRILLENNGKTAKGAELVDGQIFTARREVIICCGAIRTPQILLLSGIGPAAELSKHGIQQLVNSPEVGLNFHDHIAMTQFFKVKNPNHQGLVAGSASWNDPTYLLGIPADIVIVDTAPLEKLKAAMIADGVPVTDSHPHLQPNRGHLELLPIYAPTEAPLTNLNIPFDGTCLTVGELNLLPTSRGSVSLASADPTADPLIDPNYFSTEADKVVLRQAMRLCLQAFETSEGQEIVENEVVPEGLSKVTSKSTDAELDARIKKTAATWFHPAGSASMGKVVDTELKVIGVEKLRVCDTSVFPCPLGAHYQVATYALAEQAADLITKNWVEN